MARAWPAATAACRVCQVCHSPCRVETYEHIRLQHAQMERHGGRLRGGIAADALHRGTERNRLGPGLHILLPHVLPRRNDRQRAVHGRCNGYLFRCGHTLRGSSDVRHYDINRQVCRTAARTDIHVGHGLRLLQGQAAGPDHTCLLCRHNSPCASFRRVRHPVRHRMGAAGCQRRSCGISGLPMDEQAHKALSLHPAVHNRLNSLLLFGRLCAQQYHGAPPEGAYQRSAWPRRRPCRSGIQRPPERDSHRLGRT